MYSSNLSILGYYYGPIIESPDKIAVLKICINNVITRLNISHKTMFDGIFAKIFRQNRDFIYTRYNLSVDDQARAIIEQSEQEYLHRNFRNILYRRFPAIDENSDIPPKFKSKVTNKNLPWWKVKDIIFNRLQHLENINWSNQTLSYARSNIIGKHMVDCIINPLWWSGFLGKSFTVVDGTAGIGGDSINFGLQTYVSGVVSYEINPQTFKMLNNNVKLYGLEHKIKTVNKPFDYIIPNINCLVIIDPPYERFATGNDKPFTLSIDSTPIFNVAQKCLDVGAKCVILTMPKSYKYNAKFAYDNNQYVVAFQMADKNNKIFLIMNIEDADRYRLDNFRSFTIVPDESQLTKAGKPNLYKCKILS